MPVYICTHTHIYIYVRRLVTQSVCTRAELTKGEGEEDWRSIDRGRVEKASQLLVLLRGHGPMLAFPLELRGRRLLEHPARGPIEWRLGHFVHTWPPVTSALSRRDCTKIKRLLERGERREERAALPHSKFPRFRGFPFNNATQVYKIIRVARVETPPSVSFSVFVSRKGGYGDSYVNRGERAEEKF